MISSMVLVLLLTLTHKGRATSLMCSPANICSEESCSVAHAEFETDCPSNEASVELLGSGNDCGACSNSSTGEGLSKPSDLNLIVRPYNRKYFELAVSWTPPFGVEGLLGYKINIIAGSVSTPSGDLLDEDFQYGCHCSPNNVTEKTFQIAYSYQNHLQECDWEVIRLLNVEVFSVPYLNVSDVAAKSSVPWPTDCLSIVPPNYSICGPPVPSAPNTTVVMELLPSPEFMTATIEWEEPGNVVPGYQPSEYYILLRSTLPESIHQYRIMNATKITIYPLDATTTYYVYIQVYLPCVSSQSCVSPNLDYSCGQLNAIGMYSPLHDPPTTSADGDYPTLTTAEGDYPSLITTEGGFPTEGDYPTSTTAKGDYPSLITTEGGFPTEGDFPVESSSIILVEVLVVGGSCLISIFLVI